MRIKSKILLLILICFVITELVYPVEKIPLWKITSPDPKVTNSYIVGTVHIMPKEYQIPDFLNLLIDQCDELVLEADIANINPWEIVNHCFYKTSDKRTLKENFNEKEWSKVLELAKMLKIPEPMLLKYKPWYFSTDTSIENKTNIIMPDLIIQKYAISKNKRNYFLEKIVEQYEMFMKFPKSEINGMILGMADDIKKTWKNTENIQKAYKICDIPKLTELIHGKEYKIKYPASYKLLFNNRNEKWIPLLEKRLKKGNCIIVVGVGHLLGEGNVLELLESRGYLVEPYTFQD